jgi:hypothetical protein
MRDDPKKGYLNRTRKVKRVDSKLVWACERYKRYINREKLLLEGKVKEQK